MPRRINDTIIFIVGPTGVGKTRLAIRLAKRIGGEIISSDSMQVYRGMRILSQAPTPSERREIRHHLIGVISPAEEYSVASFRKKAVWLIESILKKGKTPIVAGGSGLYIKALIDGLFPSPKADLKFRERMQKFMLRHGLGRLHEKLMKIDPVTASAVHPNDTRRIIRALELFYSTGKTMTELKNQTKGLKDNYRIKIIGIIAPRNEIYRRIDSRVEEMFANGLIDEVKRLRKRRLSKTAKSILGFEEVSGYLEGKCGLDEAATLLKRDTRRFAKRQLTWFRPDRRIRWFDVDKTKSEDIVRRIAGEMK